MARPPTPTRPHKATRFTHLEGRAPPFSSEAGEGMRPRDLRCANAAPTRGAGAPRRPPGTLASRRAASYAPHEFGDHDGVGLAAAFGGIQGGAARIVAVEREDQLRRAQIAFCGAIGELRHRRLELGDAAFPAVFRRLDPFAERPRDHRAETMRPLRPSARVAGLAGTEAPGPRRIADPLFVLLYRGLHSHISRIHVIFHRVACGRREPLLREAGRVEAAGHTPSGAIARRETASFRTPCG